MKRSDMTIAKSLVCFLFFSPFTSAGLQQGETALLKKTRLGVLPTKTGSATKRPAKVSHIDGTSKTVCPSSFLNFASRKIGQEITQEDSWKAL